MDLDAADLAAGHEQLSEDPGLGTTESERKKNLSTIKTVTILYNVIGLFLGFVLIFLKGTLVDGVLLAYPIAGGLLMLFGRGYIKFVSDSKRSPYPYVMLGTALPGFTLLIKSLDQFNILQIRDLWLPAAAITGAIFSLFYFAGINKGIGSIRAQAIIMLVIALLYGFGSTRTLNCEFDPSNPNVYFATVTWRRVEHGKSTSYFLRLSPWGPEQVEKETEVNKGLFKATRRGHPVKILLRKGLLGISWFIIAED